MYRCFRRRARVGAVITRVGVGLAVSTSIAAGTRAQDLPNDPLFPRQYSFVGGRERVELMVSSRSVRTEACQADPNVHLNVVPAWKITKGSTAVVVAVLDDGFFYRHEDLKDNLWRNPGETGLDADGIAKEVNGQDDDENGYVDDVVGWDFAFNDPDPDEYSFDGMDATTIAPYSHGNPSLGIIGATGNNGIGIAGINWRVSLMPLKVGAQGTPRHFVDTRRIERAAAAIRYAVDNRARVISWSQFISDHRPDRLAILKESIDYAEEAGVLLVVAAGNEGVDIDRPENTFYPACFSNSNIIVVAEIDFMGRLDYTHEGRFRSASSYGARNVDIAALGRHLSTNVYHGRSVYALSGGTSHATPVVAGVAALMLSVNAKLTARELKRILMDTARPLSTLRGKIGSGGMVDAYAAVKKAQMSAGE